MHDGRTIVVRTFPRLRRTHTILLNLDYLKQGTLAGSDMKVNVILSDAVERVYSPDEGVEEVPLGLYLVKGEQM